MISKAKDDAEAQRLKHAAEVARARSAFQALKDNKDFDAAWQFLQKRFPIFGPSFVVGDEQNTHRAAIRDGEKNVMRKILQLLSLPREAEYEDGDAVPRQTSAVSELGATQDTL